MSQSRSVKLADIAREVVGEAIRRARARHAERPAGEWGIAGPLTEIGDEA
jgi:hypothetical protein